MLVQIRQTRSKPCQIAHIVHIIAPITPPEITQTNRIKCQRLEAEGGITYSKACGAFDHPHRYACAFSGRLPYSCSSRPC
jgi:hypothetical protein